MMGERILRGKPMIRYAGRTLLLVVLAASCAALFAQFRPEEIAQREVLEEFLRTAEIVRYEELGQGVTKPFKLFLRKGDRESAAVWKNPRGIQYGFLEGWQFEIAAYRLDKLIGLNMVPPAVERRFQNRVGALVLWAENENSLDDLFEKRIRIPDEVADHTQKMSWLTRAWDSLIANEDRNQQNILYTKDWRVILIDHSRAFRATGRFTKQLMFGRRGLKMSMRGTPFLFKRLPRWFVDRITGLTFESVKGAVGGSLTNREVRAILARRDLLLEEIGEMIREQGEDAVLY